MAVKFNVMLSRCLATAIPAVPVGIITQDMQVSGKGRESQLQQSTNFWEARDHMGTAMAITSGTDHKSLCSASA